MINFYKGKDEVEDIVIKPSEPETPEVETVEKPEETPEIENKPEETPEVETVEKPEETPEIENKPEEVISPSTDINDELVFKHLSEKLGKEIKDYSDLKEVETENPLSDPYIKEMYEWRKKTNRPIEDWFKFQKDYGKLDDLEVAREFLQYEYSSLTPEEIEIELEKYKTDDLDDDSDTKLKKIALKKYAEQGRKKLSELVSDLGTIKDSTLSPEVKSELEFAKQVKDNLKKQEEIQKQHNINLLKTVNNVNDIELQLSDELKINFKIDETDKKQIPDLLNQMPHWVNEDGSQNFEAIVKDVVKIKNFDKILNLAYEQGVNSGKELSVKEMNNITLNEPEGGAASTNTGKGVVIEGVDNFIGKNNMRIKKFNK